MVEDILEAVGQTQPCYYCGEADPKKHAIGLDEEHFPLCISCQNLGRGAGIKRKSRAVKPKPVKPKKVQLMKKKPVKRRKLID